MLLTQNELESFANYETVVHDKSVTRRLFEPFWERIAAYLPEDVAPNLISLASMLCLVQAWYLTFTNGEAYPRETTAAAIVLIFVFWTLDSVDWIHARNTRNDSSLTEFFDHICSSIGTIFLVLTLCECYAVTDIDSIWHYVQVGQLLIFNKHLSGLKREYISYRLFNGPGEGVTVFIILLAVRAGLGLNFVDEWADHVLNLMQSVVPPALLKVSPDLFENPSVKLSRTLFFWVLSWTVLMTLRLGTGKEHRVTRWSLLLCFMYLIIPSGLVMFSFELTLADVIARGLVTAMVSSDIVMARMANRELSPWIVIINMAALISNLFSFLLVPFYYVTIIFEICKYTRLPLLSRVINVYQDGIFDLPHIGHMVAFRRAAKHGTRLFVGVANDEDATPYKRRPIMTAKERYEAVAACKYVYKVIEDAPCKKGLLDEDFIRKHRIHIVCHGEEYNTPDDEWYATPRKMGITRILPRFDGMSTSELIKRIQARDNEELNRKSPALPAKPK